MNRSTVIAKVQHADALLEWEAVVRENWTQSSLRPLDAGYIWCCNDETVSMITLIFRDPNNNTHRDTDWFLINPVDVAIARYIDQAKMFADVKPVAGICYTLWYRIFWQEMARSPYAFDMQSIGGIMLNKAEVK